MSASALYDSVARIARHESRARAVSAVGRVVEVFSDEDHAVNVELRDTGLVLLRVPIAVGALGFAATPFVDDLVVVLFLEGDYNAPVVVGRLYHADKTPPEHADGEIVLALPSGASEPDVHVVVSESEPSIKIQLPGDVLVEMLDSKCRIEVGSMTIEADGGGGGRAEIAAGSSKVTLKQDGDITISAAGKLTLEGTEVEVKGSAKVKVSGAQVEVN